VEQDLREAAILGVSLHVLVTPVARLSSATATRSKRSLMAATRPTIATSSRPRTHSDVLFAGLEVLVTITLGGCTLQKE